MEKINKEYRQFKVMRDFGLTSLSNINELFPWTTKKVQMWELLFGPSVGGTMRLPHLPTTFKGIH